MKGQHIVRAFMKANMIGPSDFFRSRLPEHVELRRQAIELLRDAGLRFADIGRAIQKDPKTVTYWLSVDVRKRKAEKHRQYRERRIKTESRKTLSHPLLTDDFRMTIRG